MDMKDICAVCGAFLVAASPFCYSVAETCPEGCDTMADIGQDVAEALTASSSDLSGQVTASGSVNVALPDTS